MVIEIQITVYHLIYARLLNSNAEKEFSSKRHDKTMTLGDKRLAPLTHGLYFLSGEGL